MFAEMSESFLRHPEFEVRDSSFRVTLRNTPVFEGPSVEWKQMVERLPLTTAQRRVLLAHPEGFTNEEYRELNKVDRDQAYREIQEMVTMGVLTPEGHGRGAAYHLSPELHADEGLAGGPASGAAHVLQHPRGAEECGLPRAVRLARPVATRELGRLVAQDYLIRRGRTPWRSVPPRPTPRQGRSEMIVMNAI